VTVLVTAGVSIGFHPPLVPRDSPTDVGATSVVDVPRATQVVVVHPTEVIGTEMLVDGTPETTGGGDTAAVAHEAKTSAAMEPATQTRARERTLADTRLMASLSLLRRLSLR
jgi:hypothetical protein